MGAGEGAEVRESGQGAETWGRFCATSVPLAACCCGCYSACVSRGLELLAVSWVGDASGQGHRQASAAYLCCSGPLLHISPAPPQHPPALPLLVHPLRLVLPLNPELAAEKFASPIPNRPSRACSLSICGFHSLILHPQPVPSTSPPLPPCSQHCFRACRWCGRGGALCWGCETSWRLTHACLEDFPALMPALQLHFSFLASHCSLLYHTSTSALLPCHTFSPAPLHLPQTMLQSL